MTPHLGLFLIMMLLGVVVIMTAFVAFAFPIIIPPHHFDTRITILITLIIGGSLLYFLSILYLSKKKYYVISLMVIGWIVIILLNIYLWRHCFYIICMPSYQLRYLESILNGLKMAGQPSFRVKQLDLGDGVVGAHIFPSDRGQAQDTICP